MSVFYAASLRAILYAQSPSVRCFMPRLCLTFASIALLVFSLSVVVFKVIALRYYRVYVAAHHLLFC